MERWHGRYRKNMSKTERELYRKTQQEIYNNRIFGGLKNEVLKRDKRTCVICGMKNREHLKKYKRNIGVHHKNGKKNGLKLLVTICMSCHGKIHGQKPQPVGIIGKNGILIKKFNSIKEASFQMNTDRSIIRRIAMGKVKNPQGYTWRYL